MARVKNDDIERLKDDVPLQRLVESYGVKLKKKGKDLIGLCPLDIEREVVVIWREGISKGITPH